MEQQQISFYRDVVSYVWGDLGTYDDEMRALWVRANQMVIDEEVVEEAVAAVKEIAIQACRRAAELNGEYVERCMRCNKNATDHLRFYLEAIT